MFKKGFEFFEGHGEPVMEVGGGEDAGIEGAFAHVLDIREAGLEVLVGHRAWVLKLTEDGVIEAVEVAIGDNFFQGTAAVVRFAVFRTREPAEEIFHAVVKRIFDEMVADAVVGFAILVKEDFSFAIEDLTHDDVARFACTAMYRRGSISSSFRLSAPCWGIFMC